MLAPPDYVRRVDVLPEYVKDRVAEGFRLDPFPDDRGFLTANSPGRHKGRAALCMASGPSAGMIPLADIQELREESHCITWATNDVWKCCGGHPLPGADYLVILDDHFWSGYREQIGKYMMNHAPSCLPVLCHDPDEQLRFQRIAIDTGNTARGQAYSAGAFFHGHSSGNAAVQMAMHCSCNPIYLIGHDLCAHDGKTHGAGVRDRHELAGNYPQGEMMMAGYKLLAEHAAAQKTRIVNLSPVSRIECFEKSTVQAELERIRKGSKR